MKDRVKSRVWWLVGINTVVLILVLGLAYGAGARSGGLSLLDFGALPQVAGLEFLAAVFLVAAVSITLLVQLGIKVVKPTRELVEVSERVMAGDYEANANVTPDDYGVMAENWNRAAEMVAQAAGIKAGEETMRAELGELERVINQVARGDFSSRAKASQMELTAVVESFNALAETQARRMERVRALSADIAACTLQVLAASGEITNGAAEQEQITLSAAAAIAELTSSTQLVSEHATSSGGAARSALEVSGQGSSAVHEAEQAMQKIRTAMQATADKIKSLGERSLQIYEIINIIHETNLLALNAVLEFSRGAQAGLTQEIIASELRKLADHSRTSTRDIVSLLKSIQAESTEAVSVIEKGNRVAETGSHLIAQASRAFADITQELQQTSELVESIATASGEQLNGTERVAAAIQEIAANMRQYSAKSRQSAKIVEQVVRSSEQLTQVVNHARPAPVPPATVFRAEKAEAAAAAVIGRA